MASILIADDSASMRQMVSFTLKGAGYEVVEATDGLGALEIAKTHVFELDSTGYLHGLHELRLQLKQLQTDSDRSGKVVAQSTMETGDVELL